MSEHDQKNRQGHHGHATGRSGSGQSGVSGKRTLTMGLPARTGSAPVAPVQRKHDPAAEAASTQQAGQTADWMNVIMRPDLYGEPVQQRSAAGPGAGSSGRGASPSPHATGGKKRGGQYKEDEVIGGRTVGEFLGDVGRPIGTALGNVVGSVAGAVTGISITSNSLVGPTWNHHGHFDWGVMFNVTNGGQAGWVVQEIANTYRAQDNTGNAVAVNYTPRYWEAWSVDATGAIDPNFVDARGCDDWVRPNQGNNTEGHWSMRGKVYFTTTDPTTQGLAAGGVPDAGGLLAGTAAPGGLGIARLHRYAQGTWDSTGAAPVHTGSAT